MGVSGRSADRFFEAGQADRQRVRGIVQRDPSIGGPGCALFATLAEARQVIEAWRREYNESRPHRALGERTPTEIANEFAASRELIGQQTAGNSLSG